MKHSTYTSYDELPLMLSVAEVAFDHDIAVNTAVYVSRL